MSKKNKVEYKRVDEEGDDYKRILVKFNPSFWSGSDFEIEFIPLERAFTIGEFFVTKIDSMRTIDLYRWASRQDCLVHGGESDELGTILNKKDNMKRAEMLTGSWRQGRTPIEPRHIIDCIKKEFEIIAATYSEQLSHVYNYFLFSGELGSLPFENVDFNLERLKYAIEDFEYEGLTADGEVIRRSLVQHLFATHKTKYVGANICLFLRTMQIIVKRVIERDEEQQQ